MTSSYTTRNKVLKQGTGDNPNSWGDEQNTKTIDLFDTALDGVTSLTITGDVTLTSSNGAADQSRGRALKLSGSVAATITIPALEKWYIVSNGTSATQTIATSGGGTSVTVLAGEVVFVFCDATNVKRLTLSKNTTALDMGSNKITSVTDPTSAQDAATKAYVDATAFTMAAGNLPAQTGNAGKFLGTDGTTSAWTTAWATAAQIRTGTTTALGVTPGDFYSAAAEVTLTSSSNSVAIDFSLGLNFVHTLTENTTLANPTNAKIGQTGWIRIIQHASSAKTCGVGSNWKRAGGSLAVSTTLSGTDVLVFQVVTSTLILYDILRNPS